MNYYRLDIYDRQSDDYCFITQIPKEVGLLRSNIAGGIPVQPKYPERAVADMSKERGGIMLSDIIGNKILCLIAHRDVKNVIEAQCGKACEYLPLAIRNHKGRIASEDYFFVNPLGSHDCLDADHAIVNSTDEGDVIEVEKFAFNSKKLAGVPPLFRVPQDLYVYFISQSLVDAILQAKPDVTNLNLEQVEVW